MPSTSHRGLTYDARHVMRLLAPGPITEPHTVVVLLGPGETAWNPASYRPGSSSLGGPARVRYTLHPDGGVDAALETL